MTSQVTQCPSCNTSFRVTEVQLSVANGVVRCGSCLHIFNAVDHWLSYPATDNSPNQPTDPPPLETELTEPEETAAAETTASPDDIFGDDLFADDNLNEWIHQDANDNDGDFSDSFLDLDKNEESPTAMFKELDELGEDNGPEEEDWARRLLEEEAGESVEANDEFSNLFEFREEDETPLDPQLLNTPNERDEEVEATTVPEDEFVPSDESIVAGDRIGFGKTDLLANIEPEPVELDIAPQRNRWVKLAWAASIVLAGLLLVAQNVVFNFDRLSRDSSYRPAFTSICSVFGCQVPALHDTNLIRSSNLMVRSHPELKHALVVDAIIINRADFKQQFPVMELQFTDIDGAIVAGRRFKPQEYLAGELTGTSTMPTKQPIHISLEIVDPGEQAVNYQLRFYPSQGS